MKIVDKRPQDISAEAKCYDELLLVYKSFGPDTGPFTTGLKKIVGDAMWMLAEVTASRNYYYKRMLDLEQEIIYLEAEIQTMEAQRKRKK